MILNPGVLALLLSSALTTAALLWGAAFALRLLVRWDLNSGSEVQLRLERKTYLVSALLALVLGFECMSLFLLINTAELMSPLFVGAMCAAGVFNVNQWGYPALLTKSAVFVLAGAWLVINHADSRAHDYPLTRFKYSVILVLAPLGAVSSALLWAHLLGLRADVITSCCGSLFGSVGAGVNPLIPLERGPLLGSLLLTVPPAFVFSGLWYMLKGRGGLFFSLMSIGTLAVSVAGLIVYVSPFIYELPTHSCPFCILQADYRYIGYPLYAAVFSAAALGAGAGLLGPFRRKESLGPVLPWLRKRLVTASLACYLAFAGLSLWLILSSNLSLNSIFG